MLSLCPHGIHSLVLETEKQRIALDIGRWTTWPEASSVTDKAPTLKQKGLTLEQTALELF